MTKNFTTLHLLSFMITYKKEGIVINHLEFYMDENGNVPVKEFLMSLPSKLRAKAFSDIELLEKHGSNLREPHVKAMKGSGSLSGQGAVWKII